MKKEYYIPKVEITLFSTGLMNTGMAGVSGTEHSNATPIHRVSADPGNSVF